MLRGETNRKVHYLKIVIKIHQKTVSCEPNINLKSLENCTERIKCLNLKKN